jgi:hypothetical protein
MLSLSVGDRGEGSSFYTSTPRHRLAVTPALHWSTSAWLALSLPPHSSTSASVRACACERDEFVGLFGAYLHRVCVLTAGHAWMIRVCVCVCVCVCVYRHACTMRRSCGGLGASTVVVPSGAATLLEGG